MHELDRPFWMPEALAPAQPLDPVYLWKTRNTTRFAWDRTYGLEFDDAEQVRLSNAKKWLDEMKSLPFHSRLNPIDFYVQPSELAAPIRVAASDAGFVPRALSALYNCGAATLLGLFPKDKQAPEPGQLIRIESRKTAVQPTNRPPIYAVEVEAFQALSPLEAYREAMLGPHGLERFVKEHWKIDDQIRDLLLLPLTSAPATTRVKGGIALSTLAGPRNRQVLNGYLDTYKRITPPPLRGVAAPPVLHRGKWFTVEAGVSVHFAERPPPVADRTYSVLVESTSQLRPHYERRATTPGEQSFQSVLQLPSTKPRYAMLDFLAEASKADASVPGLRDALEADQEFLTLARNVTGRVHGEIAWRHLQRPVFGATEDVFARIPATLRDTLDTILLDTLPMDTVRRLRVNHMVRTAMPALERLTLAFARTAHSPSVEPEHIAAAESAYVRTMEDLVGLKEIRDLHAPLRRINKTDRGRLVLEYLLEEPKQDLAALWERVGPAGHFKDLNDLEAALERLRQEGYVWPDNNGRYSIV